MTTMFSGVFDWQNVWSYIWVSSTKFCFCFITKGAKYHEFVHFHKLSSFPSVKLNWVTITFWMYSYSCFIIIETYFMFPRHITHRRGSSCTALWSDHYCQDLLTLIKSVLSAFSWNSSQFVLDDNEEMILNQFSC